MTNARVILSVTALLPLISSAAAAQQSQTGMLIMVDRINHTVAIQQTPGGTVGANAASPNQQFKVPDNVSLEDIHAGDRVSYSVSDTGGGKTLSKLDKQK